MSINIHVESSDTDCFYSVLRMSGAWICAHMHVHMHVCVHTRAQKHT